VNGPAIVRAVVLLYGAVLIGGVLRLGAALLAAISPSGLDLGIAVAVAIVSLLATLTGMYLYVRFVLPIMNDYYRSFGQRPLEVSMAGIGRATRVIVPMAVAGVLVAILLPGPVAAAIAIAVAVILRIVLLAATAKRPGLGR
jgi:hypothetical protein